jgi:hypothetical protein
VGQAVFDAEQRCGRAGRHAQLGVDVLDVVFGGAPGNAELGADVGIRAARSDEPEDLSTSRWLSRRAADPG